jgi:hypothetical protein
MTVVLMQREDSSTGTALAVVVVIDHLEVVILANGARPLHRRAGIDCLDKTFQTLCCANIAPVAVCQVIEASTDPDGGWHTEACHPVQRVASNLCFNLLTGQILAKESPSNDRFVPIHCSLDKASGVVAGTTLPANATMLFDGRNMLIALRRPCPFSKPSAPPDRQGGGARG